MSKLATNVVGNTAIGIKAMSKATSAHRCICLGNNSGNWITDEKYQFCIALGGEELVELRTTMSETEWYTIRTVILRALSNGTWPRKKIEGDQE